jgi:hypothetical protein
MVVVDLFIALEVVVRRITSAGDQQYSLKQILQGCLCVGVGLHRIHVAGVKM